MTQFIGPRNPIAYAWFHARGGLRSHLIMTSLISAGLLAAILLTTTLGRDSRGGSVAVLSFWAIALLVIQSTSIVLVGGLGIVNAIRMDAGSGMHDSMRMMRASPGAVVMGYLTGASSQLLNVFIPCTIAGAVCSSVGGVGAGPWLWASMLLVSTGAMLLVVAAFTGMMFKQAQVLLIFGGMFGAFLIVLMAFVPGLVMLSGPAAGRGALSLRNQDISPLITICVVCQAGLATLFFFAAAHKFRYPQKPAFGIKGGIRLLAFWSIISCIGLTLWDEVRPRFGPPNELSTNQIIGTLFTGLLISLVAIVSIARSMGEWRTMRAAGIRARRPAAEPLLLLVTILVAGPALFAVKTPYLQPLAPPLAATLVATGAFSFSCAALMTRAFSSGKRALVVAMFSLCAALLLLPLMGEAFISLWLDAHGDVLDGRPLAWFGQFSPFGTYVSAWWEKQPLRFDESPLFPGVLAQALLALSLWSGILLPVKPRRDRQIAKPAPAGESAASGA